MPLPCFAAHSRKPTTAPRPRRRRASSARAKRTRSFWLESASYAMMTFRPFQAMRSRSGIGPFTSNRSPSGPFCLSDRAAPVVNAGDSNRKESRTFRVPIREPPKRECFEFAFRDDERQRHFAKLSVRHARREVQHVATTGRAEILLLRLNPAIAIDLHIRVIAPKPVLTDFNSCLERNRES